MTLRHSGILPEGALVDGVRHRDFELRPPTVLDNVEAVDEVGTSNGVALSASILARQLVKLGTLRPEQITYELLTGLHPSDFNHLEAQSAELEKKRVAALTPAGSSPDSGSAFSAPD